MGGADGHDPLWFHGPGNRCGLRGPGAAQDGYGGGCRRPGRRHGAGLQPEAGSSLAEAAAIAKAESFALENGADFIDSITIETVEHNGENLKAVVARVGCNVEYTFGKLLGFEGQKVYASATAVYGFPLDGSNILPIRHDSNIELGSR